MHQVSIAPINLNNYESLIDIIPSLESLSSLKFEITPIQLDLSEAYSAERGQYHSTKIIKLLKEKISVTEKKIIGVVGIDLFIPVLTYVFGEAQLNGNYSLISIFRLHEELYSGQSDNNLLQQRIIKEILHELGHNFGLIHCKDWSCVMHSSSSIEEVDIKGITYCSHCKGQILV
jgi:archaemetzincin